MRKIELKFLNFISDPSLSDRDIDTLLQFINSQEFKDLRNTLINRNNYQVLTNKSRVIDSHLVNIIKHLLINEAKLTPTQAIHALLTEIRDDVIPTKKWTISSGLKYALQFSSKEEIISAAQRVYANKQGLHKGHAWSLNNKNITNV